MVLGRTKDDVSAWVVVEEFVSGTGRPIQDWDRYQCLASRRHGECRASLVNVKLSLPWSTLEQGCGVANTSKSWRCDAQ